MSKFALSIFFSRFEQSSQSKTNNPLPPSQFSFSFGQVGQTASPTTPLQPTLFEKGETVSSPSIHRPPAHTVQDPLSQLFLLCPS